MKKHMFALALFSSSVLGWAAPASVESIEQLFELTDTASIARSMESAIDQIVLETMPPSDAYRRLPEVKRHAFEMRIKALREEFNWQRLAPYYIKIYQETFEEEEIQALISFYHSPFGQTIVKKMPLVLQKSASFSQDIIRTLKPRFDQLITEAPVDLDKKKLFEDEEISLDTEITSQNIYKKGILVPTRNNPYAGFWKTSCTDEVGIALITEGRGMYSVRICAPGGCIRSPNHPNTSLVNDPSYKIESVRQFRQIETGNRYVKCWPTSSKYGGSRAHR
jgi:hypothetical protein